MATIKNDIAALTQAVGVGAQGSLVERVDRIVSELGLAEKLQSKPLVERVEACKAAVFGGIGAVERGIVASVQLDVGTEIPVYTAVGTPVNATPVPMSMDHYGIDAVPLDSLAQWVAEFPVSGGPRANQASALGWFDTTFHEHAWPLQRAAMRGEVDRIRELCASGHDPNVKMTPWYDSEPLGWAASFGQLGAVIALIQCGADPLRPKNKAGYTPLTDAMRERHTHVIDFLNEYRRRRKGTGTAPTTATRGMGSGRLFDRRAYPNGGPRADQNVCILSICCAAPFILCPTHCLSAWGCTNAVDSLTSCWPCKHIPCTPCDPNSKNPLWCCAEPLGWAASFGQLHTVMALVKNGANPDTYNAANQNAYTDASREHHQHVVDWLQEWEGAGRPRGDDSTLSVARQNTNDSRLDARSAQGCYIGACIIPCLITAFYVNAESADELQASGMTLVFPWSYKLQRSATRPRTTFELRAPDQQQDWMWHPSGCCFWGSPGWWALRVLPTAWL
mmetsp:Transcript_8549/g.22351  ORF Transcript_8549/g.22351 Transcript_8549/m.22351 type:complete len:505 (+) Transcript_8549:86-1600(+)